MKTCWVFLLVVFNLLAMDNTGKKVDREDLMTARTIWLGREKMFYVLVKHYQDIEMPILMSHHDPYAIKIDHRERLYTFYLYFINPVQKKSITMSFGEWDRILADNEFTILMRIKARTRHKSTKQIACTIL